MNDRLAAALGAIAVPRIMVSRPPWWRPFARRRFDRAMRGLRLLGPGRIIPILPSRGDA